MYSHLRYVGVKTLAIATMAVCSLNQRSPVLNRKKSQLLSGVVQTVEKTFNAFSPLTIMQKLYNLNKSLA
jgi:hypothetical protein